MPAGSFPNGKTNRLNSNSSNHQKGLSSRKSKMQSLRLSIPASFQMEGSTSASDCRFAFSPPTAMTENQVRLELCYQIIRSHTKSPKVSNWRKQKCTMSRFMCPNPMRSFSKKDGSRASGSGADASGISAKAKSFTFGLVMRPFRSTKTRLFCRLSKIQSGIWPNNSDKWFLQVSRASECLHP